MSDQYSQDGSQETVQTKDKQTAANISKIESCRTGENEVIEPRGTRGSIKSRHAQMIAIGGAIGTGLFVGLGQALATGGPGFLLAAYCLASLSVYGVVTAVVEIVVHLPLSGYSMASYCSRFVSPSLGFALGCLYFYSFGIIVAYEITAAAIVINYWPNDINIAVWIALMSIVIVALNLSPVGVYAETEFWFARIKVILIIGLLLLSLVLMLGGGSDHTRLGFRYWEDPGAVKTYLVPGAGGRLAAFIETWILSGISFFFSPELLVFTAPELRNPRKNLPTAARTYFARLVVFYVLGTIAIGAICNSNSEELLSGSGNANASPWVIAIRNVHISALPSIINAGILTSAWSAGNAFLYMSSRALYSLAVAGHAPSVFTKCTKYGLPIYAVLASSCFTLLGFPNVSDQAGAVFNWFINLTNTAGFISWIVCCVSFLRFRKACRAQDVEVPYRSKVQPYAAWICIVVFTFLLLFNGLAVFFPGQFSASRFLTAYLGIPIFLVLWLGHKFTAGRNHPWLWKPSLIDITTGLAEVDADEFTSETKEVSSLTKLYRKVANLCGGAREWS